MEIAKTHTHTDTLTPYRLSKIAPVAICYYGYLSILANRPERVFWHMYSMYCRGNEAGREKMGGGSIHNQNLLVIINLEREKNEWKFRKMWGHISCTLLQFIRCKSGFGIKQM